MARSDFRSGADYSRRTSLSCVSTCLVVLWAVVLPGNAQVSFTSAISLALQNSPRVKIAESDVQRAQAALAVTKDIFIPSVLAAGG
ncbi:MAG TPA: TolC family protein, partial [Edaphobacter sp.]|nr:TolC family protein [Edaphobacter sp.]